MDGQVVIGTSLDTSDLDKSLGSLEKNLTTRVKGMTNTVTRAFTSLKRTILGLGIFALVRNMFSFNDAISRVDTINNYARVMGNLGISSKDAESSIKRLSDALTGLPTSLDDAALSVQRFTSANGNIKASTEMFLALNNAILAGGANMQIQQSALEQLSQAYAKGKPDMMEWRTALMAMPAQLKQVALAMGYVSADQLGEALRNGTVSMNEFMTTIIKLNKQGANGFKSFEEQARGSTGGIRTAITNLRTSITRALADIMNAIGQSNIADFFNGIAKAINKVVPYIAGFVKAILMLFGINNKKQADDTASSFENLGGASLDAADGFDDATSSAKALNKELKGLASFDEMNVLPDKSDSGSAGGVGASAGGMDLGDLGLSGYESNLGEIADKTQQIAEKIKGFLEPIISRWKEIVAIILGAKAALEIFKLTLDPLLSIGIGLLIGGVVLAIEGLISYLNDPSWKNFGTVIQGIGIAIIGVGVIIGGFPVIIAGVIALIWGTIVKYWDKIQAFLQSGIDWLKSKSDWVHKTFGETIGKMYDNFVSTLQGILNWAGRTMNGIKKNFDEIISFVKNVFAGNWKGAWQNVKNIFSNIWNGMKDTAITVFNAILNLGKNIGIGVGNAIAGAFKAVVNGVLNAIESILNKPINTINSLIGVINKVPGIKLGRLSTFRLPRLAKGAIASYPGRGIPTVGGGATWAEAGREAYLPLTDEQIMDTLGQSIARHMVINANITNTMNGRVISRELQKINNESDFAFNK